MLSWSNLHTFDSSQRKGFEQFCYTIAKRKYGHRGVFTPIDDSGGGSGVEFYLTFPDGEVWGWQAKFFPDGRLNGSRKEQIKKSLKRSCEDHPTLRRWFLCTPMDYTPGEQKWFEETLPSSISDEVPVVPTGRILGLNHWGDTRFNDFLTEEWSTGIHQYYFGELELSQSWFGKVYRKVLRSPAGKRYTADLHSKSDVSEQAQRTLLSEAYLSHLDNRLEKLKTAFDELRRTIRNVKQGRTSHESWEGSREAYLEASRADETLEMIETAASRIREAVACLHRDELDLSDVLDGADEHAELLHSLRSIFKEAIGLTRRRKLGAKESSKDDTSLERGDFSDVTSDEHDIYTKARNVLRPCEKLLKSLLKAQENILHVLGDAGTGKTHLAFDLCHSRLETGRPSVLLLGTSITSREPLRRQLLNALDIPPSYSWEDFLDALDIAAERAFGRLPIVIDGLNESVVGGHLSPVWKNELEGLADEIGQYENLALITTCRTAYVQGIWQDSKPERAVETRGFGRETEEAITRYFDYYSIDANLTGAPLEQFKHPIYLRIFCEATNPDRKEVKYVHLGEHKLFQVFEDYVDQRNQRVADRLGKRLGKEILRSALNRVALVLWEEKKRRIPVQRAIECIDQVPEKDIETWEQSLTHTIEDEGLLLSRTWSQSDDEGEEYEFAYDLMAGYFIASAIIDLFEDDLEVYLNDEDTLNALYGSPDQRHPLHEDINRCLAALLPERKERYLHDVIQHSEPFRYSVSALFEIDPSYISKGAVNLVDDLFATPENQPILFRQAESTWLHADHPLGVDFIEARLMEMTMAERDLSWSEYIRGWKGRQWTEDAVASLYERCADDSPVQKREEKRLHFLATRVMWALTTTIRPLRDKATRAVYRYGRRFPSRFFGLLRRSFRIDDPYVRERMLAAAYGVAMARQYDFESDEFVDQHLPTWGRFLYKSMFGSQAPCRTSHVLMRDYARHIIDIAEMHHPDLFTPDELDAARPPYNGGDIENWGTDTGRPATDDSVGPILMDFDNYTLGRLVPDRSSYDDDHPVFQELKGKAYWRIYDLGWTTDRFGQIDRGIQRDQSLSRHNQAGKTDRYGKKYSWIAYFELYGHRLDHDAVDQWDLRLSDVDLDPSFPEAPSSQKLLDQHWLGHPDVSTKSWIEDGDIPNLESFALRQEICGEEGPWVLLSAFYDHDDTELERDLWFRVCGALVNTTEVERSVASKRLRENVHSGGIIPSNHYTFAGEVPWADTFPNNETIPISETLDSRTYPKEVLDIVNGDELSEQARSKIFEELQRLLKAHSGPVDSVNQLNNLSDDDEVEFELVTVGDYEIECVQMINVLSAVWRNDWEDYHNEINAGPRGEVPARQICDSLGLVSRPQTHDLFEPSGERATITTHFEQEQGLVRHKQQFLYIRKDLIDQYLTQTSQALLIWMGGERQYSVKVFSDKRSSEDFAPPYRTNFHDVHPLNPCG